jgi:hypothetical protein
VRRLSLSPEPFTTFKGKLRKGTEGKESLESSPPAFTEGKSQEIFRFAQACLEHSEGMTRIKVIVTTAL